MVPKRLIDEGEEDGYRVTNQESKRKIASSNFARNVMHGLSPQELVSTLEPLIRGWVRDEVQRACQSFCCTSPRSPFNALEPCGSASLQLRFQSKLPHMLFTGSKVESEDATSVKLVLFDTDTNTIVSSGPLSSMKIEIIPLDGDFSFDDQEDWSQKDFEAKVIYARDGKRPLVTGDLVVILKDGIGDLGDVFFTDNSSWRRSRKFRLGARAQNGQNRVRIREARSDAFVVKDHRGESYKKHHPPSLGDEIWRLEKIAKGGVFHRRLTAHKIRTVKDFLQMYVANQSSLRKILGGSSNKTWETIVKHAQDCVLDDKLYVYGAEGIGLLFNSVFKVMGATFDAGQSYTPLEKLAEFQMPVPVIESLKQQLFKNLEGLLPMDDLSIFGVSVAPANLPVLQGINFPAPQPDQLQMQLASPPYTSGPDDIHQSDVFIPEGSSMPFFSPLLRNSFTMKDFHTGLYGEGSSSGPGMPSDWLDADSNFQVGPLLFQGNEPCIARSPRARWCKIRAAVKWVSVMRAKRMARLCRYLDFSA